MQGGSSLVAYLAPCPVFSELSQVTDWAFSLLHFPCSKWHWFLPSHQNPVLEDLLGSSSSLTPSLFTSSVLSILPPGASPSRPAPSLGTRELPRLSASFLQEACSNVLFYLPASPPPPILQATARGNLQTCSLMSSLLLQILKGCFRQAQFMSLPLLSPCPSLTGFLPLGTCPAPQLPGASAPPVHQVRTLLLTFVRLVLRGFWSSALLCSLDFPDHPV